MDFLWVFLVVILCCGMVGRRVLYENICRLRGFFRGEEVFSCVRREMKRVFARFFCGISFCFDVGVKVR